MFGRILMPLDGSALAESALRHVAALAKICDAEVMLLRVIDRERRSDGVAEDVLAWDFRCVEADSYLATLAERFRSRGINASVAVEEGDAAERILGHVVAREADLLVLTSHGHGGITEFGVGGTARKVLSRSPVSVLLIPAGDSSTDDPEQPIYRTVAAFVDCSQRGDGAVGVASQIARGTSAELVLVHVVPEPELTSRMPLDAEDLALIERVVLRNQRVADRYLREVRARLSGQGHPVRVHCSVARNVVRELTDFMSKVRPDLVVTCSHGSTARSEGSFGAVARSLLTRVHIPLLAVQDDHVPRFHDRSPAGTPLGIRR